MKKTREGILDWKQIDWILNPSNLGIAEMVKEYLPVLLEKAGDYSFEYKDDMLNTCKIKVFTYRFHDLTPLLSILSEEFNKET